MGIKFKPDKVKDAKRKSRAIFGKPGQGRKTTFVDRKKKQNKEECRDSYECDECDGNGYYYIDGEARVCICAEPQE